MGIYGNDFIKWDCDREKKRFVSGATEQNSDVYGKSYGAIVFELEINSKQSGWQHSFSEWKFIH